MTGEEVIKAYKEESPVDYRPDEGLCFRYNRIYGYEVTRGTDGAKEINVILLDKEPRRRITIALPEKVFLAKMD